METSPKPTAWIGLGFISVAALTAAYNLGRISAESDKQPQPHQDAACKDDPDLQSALSATRKRLASCEKTLQRRDPPPQKREEKLHADDDNPTPSPEPELPRQCIVASQAKELGMLAANCTNFRRHFDAYKAILGSSTIGCEAVLSIRDLARNQCSICSAIIRASEEADYQDAASDPLGADAVENAYMLRSEYGDTDVNELVKNPECIARMQAE